MNLKVIFVDDEYRVLDGLRRVLREKKGEWVMGFASSGKEALEMMQEVDYDVIVSDIKMPGMSGEELLTIIKERYPAISRIVLTGYHTYESAYRLTSSDHFHLSKPCRKDVFIRTIEEAAQLKEFSEKSYKNADNNEITHSSLTNEELTIAFVEYFTDMLLKGKLELDDVPVAFRVYLSQSMLNVFAPVIQPPNFNMGDLETEEVKEYLGNWVNITE